MKNLDLTRIRIRMLGKPIQYETTSRKGVHKAVVGKIVEVVKGGLLMDTHTGKITKNTVKFKIKPAIGRAIWTDSMSVSFTNK